MRVGCAVVSFSDHGAVGAFAVFQRNRAARGADRYIVVLGLWPLARLFVESLSPGASGEVLGLLLGQWRSAATQRALINTLESSLLATLLSVAIGTTAAFVLTLTDVRAKAALTFVALLPLLVPSQITALAWIELTGAGSPILGPLGLGARAGRDQSALFEVGHRAGDGHRKLDARVPRGARGACATCRATWSRPPALAARIRCASRRP